MNFENAFDRLISHEGGYVNHPSDPGGETNHGVTKRVAEEHGYNGDMISFTRDQAKAIYKKAYWDKCKAGEFDYAIGFQLFDAAVNHGIGSSVKFLQRSAGVKDDGVIGPATIAAVNSKQVHDIIMLFNAARLDFYTNLSTFDTFGKGWVRRVSGNLRYCAKDI